MNNVQELRLLLEQCNTGERWRGAEIRNLLCIVNDAEEQLQEIEEALAGVRERVTALLANPESCGAHQQYKDAEIPETLRSGDIDPKHNV